MVIGLSGDATSLNPVIATDGISYTVEWPIFDSLLELDASLNVQPLLAESWDGVEGRPHLHLQAEEGRDLARRQAVHARATWPSPSTPSSTPR